MRDSDAWEAGCVQLDRGREPRNPGRRRDGNCTLFIALPFPLFPAPENDVYSTGESELWCSRVKSHFRSCELSNESRWPRIETSLLDVTNVLLLRAACNHAGFVQAGHATRCALTRNVLCR